MEMRQAATDAPRPADPKSAETALWIRGSSAILEMETDQSSLVTASITTVTMIARCPSAATVSGMQDASAGDEVKNVTTEI